MRIEFDAPSSLYAPAKLNLGLEVTGRRPDGYHEVVTILQTVDLFDRLHVEPAAHCTYVSPCGIADDLVARALHALSSRGIEVAARITLEKRIPIAAGLGGGSSDAGTLLRALVARGLDAQSAEEIAAALGSDVPFFLRGGTALATGRGTELEPLPTPSAWFVVAVPPVHLPNKTRRLYRSLVPDDFSDGTATRTQADRLRRGLPLDPELIKNPFIRQLTSHSGVRAAIQALRDAGAHRVWPTGAGPAVYALADDEAHATRLAQNARRTQLQVLVCSALGASALTGP